MLSMCVSGQTSAREHGGACTSACVRVAVLRCECSVRARVSVSACARAWVQMGDG